MNEETHVALELAASRLSERELAAYKNWQNSRYPALAPDTQGKLFQLFLNGKSCEAIRALNPQFTLGMIVNARITGQWDRLYQEHIDDLLNNTKMRATQAQLESINFVSDLLSATNRMHGEKIAKYLQTGNEKDLGDLQITTLTGYKTAVELLQKLTGQDKQQKVTGDLTITHKADDSMSAGRAPNSEEAADILKMLLGKKDKE